MYKTVYISLGVYYITKIIKLLTKNKFVLFYKKTIWSLLGGKIIT